MEVCAIARNGSGGEKGTTVGSKEDIENWMGEEEEQRGQWEERRGS